jgi:hypothetical protein
MQTLNDIDQSTVFYGLKGRESSVVRDRLSTCPPENYYLTLAALPASQRLAFASA